MGDEIHTTAELKERAELREVVILRVAADRGGASPLTLDSPPAELHAPESTEDFAAVELGTRLSNTELVVTLAVHACNAYAGFHADAEAIFDLAAPIALGKEAIVQEFTGTVGATTIFPYVRSAVAALAAHLSVPATPLPLLPPGGMELQNDETSAPPAPEGVLVAGTYTRTADDGTTEQLGEFFIDAETGNLVRFGHEGVDPDIEAMLEVLAGVAAGGGWVDIASADEETWQGLIREHGLDEVLALAESIRPTEGDEAADGALARIGAAAANIALEESIAALNESVDALGEAVSAAKADDHEFTDPEATPARLLAAATDLITRFRRFSDL